MSAKNIDFTSDDAFNDWKPTSSSVISSTTDVPLQNDNMVRVKKRIAEPNKYGEPPAKKPAASISTGVGFKWNLQVLAHAADAVHLGGKSPVSVLNELGLRVSYQVLRQGGPAHCPNFTIVVTVAGMKYEGWGHSKREARAAAAKCCLEALLTRAGRVLTPPAPEHQDFTADAHPGLELRDIKPRPIVKVTSSNVENGAVSQLCPSSSLPSPAHNMLFGSPSSSICKSPINILYENYPGLTFDCTLGDGSHVDNVEAPSQLAHSMRFKVVCIINGQKFEGYGSSKKLAKLAAANSALAVLEEGKSIEQLQRPDHVDYLSQTLADNIGNIINEKFHELMKNDSIHVKRKVLAAIVITINHRIEKAKIVAIATGTKCISGEYMSVRGRAVNDCHAEIVARRCLQRHLYAQLHMYAMQTDPTVTIDESDLEPVPGGGYQMKPNRQVHLYVSTAPCGDGRIFSPHESPEPGPDKHPNRLARGQLRTKIESGEGTIPVKSSLDYVQTWDGVIQGVRLLTMSCSDKIARWCVIGLQGALLSQWIRPVYMHSLVLGSVLHPHHIYRAIHGRIERHISSLPPPYRLHMPLLARAANTEARLPNRAPSFSVCWSCTTPTIPEILNATTGKLENGQPSLLCKQTMFARWQYILKRLPQLEQTSNSDCSSSLLSEKMENMLYSEAKELSTTYKEAKSQLFNAFDKAKLGRWIRKPIEQDQFVCELIDADPRALFA